jgi:hypothetical protein
MAINRAAVKKLAELKGSGRLVLVFPAGTRFGPGSRIEKGCSGDRFLYQEFRQFLPGGHKWEHPQNKPLGEMEDDLLHWIGLYLPSEMCIRAKRSFNT